SDLPDFVISGIGDKEIAGGIEFNATRAGQASRHGRAPITARTPAPITRCRCEDASGRDLPDLAIVGIGDEHLAIRVYGNTVHIVELRGYGRDAILCNARRSDTGDDRQ